MCGILGVIAVGERTDLTLGSLERAFRAGLHRSQSRGKDASGLLAWTRDGAVVAKSPARAARLLRSREAARVLDAAREEALAGGPYLVLGHTRMMTSGDTADPVNNQPVSRGHVATLHNGIIVNAARIWAELPVEPEADVDTEAFVAAMLHAVTSGATAEAAFREAFLRLEGANTIAALDVRSPTVHLATSNGSCHLLEDPARGLVVFASEPRLVAGMARILGLRRDPSRIRQLGPGGIRAVAAGTADGSPSIRALHPRAPRPPHPRPGRTRHADLERLLAVDTEAIASLQRCRTCVLPATFPFLDLDDAGVCVLCRTAEPRTLRPIDELLAALEVERSRGRAPEVLVPISGGRDSCYALHHIVTELGIPAIAYTYDWGFVTDRARRNISRVCGALGVEHVLVAADLRRKRANVRRNLLAWARRPHLGMIPLFMAGDKHFFHYAGAVRRERGLSGTIFSMNWLERTDFKAGFASVDDRSRTGRTYELRPSSRARLAAFYASQAIRNPTYLNRSIADSVTGFAAYYLRRQDYHQLFDHLDWDEGTVNRTIIDGYGWETAEDSASTWRVGDGTAAFYNFAYLSAAGFTEHDTFRSNQIRAGRLDRATALRLVHEENVPQAAEFATYCDTVGIDASVLVDAVRRMPRRY